MTPIHDVNEIDRAAAVYALKLRRKYPEIEKLRAEFQKHRDIQARLDDRRKCHSVDQMAIISQGFRIAIEMSEADHIVRVNEMAEEGK